MAICFNTTTRVKKRNIRSRLFVHSCRIYKFVVVIGGGRWSDQCRCSDCIISRRTIRSYNAVSRSDELATQPPAAASDGDHSNEKRRHRVASRYGHWRRRTSWCGAEHRAYYGLPIIRRLSHAREGHWRKGRPEISAIGRWTVGIEPASKRCFWLVWLLFLELELACQ